MSRVFVILLGFLMGCADHAAQYASALSAVRSMPFSEQFIREFGGDCRFTVKYYDGLHGKPGAVIRVVYDRRYEIVADCDVSFKNDWREVEPVSTWTIQVTEIQSAGVSSHGTPVVQFGRNWRYGQKEWSEAVFEKGGFSALLLPQIPAVMGKGVELFEASNGQAIVRDEKNEHVSGDSL